MNLLNIHGVSVAVKSDSTAFEEFVRNSLFYFIKDNDIFDEDSIFSIDVNINMNKSVSASRYVEGFEKIGNRAYVRGGIYVCFLTANHLIRFEQYDRKLNVRLLRVRPETSYGKCRNWLKNFIKPEDFYFILRQTVIFTVFWALARYASIFAMHGAGIVISGEAVALVGLAGIGKSTTSLALTLKKNALFLADNYLLYDGEKLYPFPEWIRLSPDVEQLLDVSVKKLGAPSFTRFGRSYYQLDNAYIGKPANPRLIIFPRLADRTELREISKTAAADRIILSNNHVCEFPDHAFPGLVDYLYTFETSAYESMLVNLRSLLDNVDLYEMLVPQNASVGETCETILALMGK